MQLKEDEKLKEATQIIIKGITILLSNRSRIIHCLIYSVGDFWYLKLQVLYML